MSIADKLGFGPSRRITQLPDGRYIIHVRPPAMIGDLPEQQVPLTEEQYEGYKRWRDTGALIQDCLPDLSPSQREMLMTGLGDEEFHEICKDLDADPRLQGSSRLPIPPDSHPTDDDQDA